MPEKVFIGERDVPTVANDDVIEETDAEQFAGLFEAAGDHHVPRPMARVSTLVPVRDDDGGRIL